MFGEDVDFDSEEYLSGLSGFEAAIIRNTIDVYRRKNNHINWNVKKNYTQNELSHSEQINFENDSYVPIKKNIRTSIVPSSDTIEKINYFNDVDKPIDDTKENKRKRVDDGKKSVNCIGNKKLTKVIFNWLDNADPTRDTNNNQSIKDTKIQSKIICGDDGRMTFVKTPASLKCKPDKPTIKFNDSIKKLDDDVINAILENVASNTTVEVGFCIIYKEGLCQLNDGLSTLSDTRTPKTLLIFIQRNDGRNYYYMNINKNQSTDTILKRTLIETLMRCNARKICYKSQDLILLLIQMFKFERRVVCLEWLIVDPEIGCFLLNPDDPPSTFAEILSQFDMTPPAEESNMRILETAASYLPSLSECCRKMYAKLNDNNIWSVFIGMEAKITPILALMEWRGMCIDTRALNEMSSVLDDKSKLIESKATRIIGKSIQLNSPNQLRTILFDDLKLDILSGVKIKETSTTGIKSTSESVLRQLIPFHPLPALILNYRHVNKAKATFIDAILQQSKSGIISATWDQTAAATGRITSYNPNLQSIPKHPFTLNLIPIDDDGEMLPSLILRNAFIARSGYWLVAADFQHIECRVFAHMTNDETLINIIRQDDDIFKSLAKKWLNKSSVDDVTSDDRDKTKRIVYAMMYGAGTNKLAEILNSSADNVAEIVAKFSESFPALNTFKRNIIDKCRAQDGVLHSISGRMRKFPNINSRSYNLRSHAERQAINFVIQGSAADLCKTAMIATERRLACLPETDHHLLLQIHDELVWEVPDDRVSKFRFVIREVMQSSGEFWGNFSIPLPVVVTQGKSWGEMF